MSILGAGLLLGTAVAVIIPEGCHELIEAQLSEDNEGEVQHAETDHDHTDHTHADHEHGMFLFPAGSSILLGFITMLIMDRALPCFGGHHKDHVSDQLCDMENSNADQAKENQSLLGLEGRQAFFGLCVHAVADGLAIGVASSGTNTQLTMLLGASMVMHKGPAAFGLVTYLASSHWSQKQLVTGLTLFSAVTPVAAAVIYACLSLVPSLSLGIGPALCILFSGGTFLYAACCHILPEVVGHDSVLTCTQLATLVAGSFIPALLSVLHTHGGE